MQPLCERDYSVRVIGQGFCVSCITSCNLVFTDVAACKTLLWRWDRINPISVGAGVGDQWVQRGAPVSSDSCTILFSGSSQTYFVAPAKFPNSLS